MNKNYNMDVRKLLIQFEFKHQIFNMEVLNDITSDYTKSIFTTNDGTIWDFFIINSVYYKQLYGDYQIGLCTYPNNIDHHHFTPLAKNIKIKIIN